MNRLVRTVLVAATLALLMGALAAPASAHELTVTNPHTGEIVVDGHWIGGFTVPEPAQDAPPMFGPFRIPPSHGHGLPMACMGTGNSPAVTITAPPFFTGCEHGQP